MSELWDFTRISVTQNNLQELKEIWNQWDDEIKQLFYREYGFDLGTSGCEEKGRRLHLESSSLKQ
ncbi:hypothetical protein Goklo_025367 [Gossypium klotzschianum]|uniref:Uncharacterized protein n=1 Tax=Gossypium klotzschianum TaxID=34286 RepID=A0A7J8WEB6_9ROSI|nr:hypothetical protein [Gossypium klotzschianum]